MAFPTKNSVFGRCSSLPPRPPPLKSANFIFIVVSPSLNVRQSHILCVGGIFAFRGLSSSVAGRWVVNLKYPDCYFACYPDNFCVTLCCESSLLSLPGNLALKNGGDFWLIYVVSVSQETKHKKSSKNSEEIWSIFWCKIWDENSKNSGELSFCTFST